MVPAFGKLLEVSSDNLPKAKKRVILKPQHRLLSTATPLTRNNSTIAAKTLCYDTFFNLSFNVTKYFAQCILVTQLIVIYDC